MFTSKWHALNDWRVLNVWFGHRSSGMWQRTQWSAETMTARNVIHSLKPKSERFGALISFIFAWRCFPRPYQSLDMFILWLFPFSLFFFVAFFQCEQWDCFLCASVYGGARLKWWVNEWTKKAEMLDVDNDAWPVKIFMFGSFGVYEPFCSLECIAFIYSL